MKDQTNLVMNKHDVPLDHGASNRAHSNKKSYRTPQLRRLGDFRSMTRTGDLVPQFQDILTSNFYIS